MKTVGKNFLWVELHGNDTARNTLRYTHALCMSVTFAEHRFVKIHGIRKYSNGTAICHTSVVWSTCFVWGVVQPAKVLLLHLKVRHL